MRDLFQQAQEKAPAIIFIDELDAIGKARGMSPMSGHEERENTLNQLLAEMDGFDTRKGVIMMAATNRPEILDPALIRPGRFDRQILVDRPSLKGREDILKIHTKNVKLAPDVDLHTLAARTPGHGGVGSRQHRQRSGFAGGPAGPDCSDHAGPGGSHRPGGGRPREAQPL